MDFGADNELTALEFARLYKLTKPYDEKIDFNIGNAPIGDSGPDKLFPSDADLTHAVSELLKERFLINKDAALLLKSVHELREPPKYELRVDGKRERLKGLKQELPLLKTAHEIDMLDFGNDQVPGLHDLKIPTEVVNGEDDEGFTWPAKYFKYIKQCDERLKGEKLAVSRDEIRYLQDTMCDSYTSAEAEASKVESMPYKKNEAIQPVTPPLLPLSPPLTPYVPSSPANHIPLPSDSSDSVLLEAKALEEQIMAADSIICGDSDGADSMLLELTHPSDFTSVFEPAPETNLKRRAEDLKVEGPLTPPMFSDSPMKKLKSVSFTADLHEIIPATTWAKAFSDDNWNDGDSSGLEEIFAKIEPIVEKARAKIENEKLSGADTTARVEVPDLDFSLPTPPWHEYSRRRGGKHRPGDTEIGAQMRYLFRVKNEDLRTASPWHGLSALERELRWSIFTAKISKITIEEKLHGEMDFKAIANDGMEENIAYSSSLLWKREGLRVLDEDEEEEQIEFAETEEETEMRDLVRKRKLEMDEDEGDSGRRVYGSAKAREPRGPGFVSEIQQQGTAAKHPDTRRPPDQMTKQQTNKENVGFLFGGFSAKSALHRFMETRGKKIQRVDAAVDKGHSNHSAASAVDGENTKSPQKNQEGSEEGTRPCSSMEKSLSVLQLPLVPTNLPPCFAIFSMAYLQQRTFNRQITELYPEAEVIYRDYQLPHSPSKEADMILSPSTGLITTTLQQIKQRPLPGQVDRNPIKERMKQLQLRYERLIVLVSEGLSREMEASGSSRPEDSRDAEALSNLENFAAECEGEIIVRNVPGGEQALARSVVLEMSKYCLPCGSEDIGDIRLLPVETTWEVFLRRVGFNPFAAQIIVAWLKQPYDCTVTGISSSPGFFGQPETIPVSGLPGFLMMSGEERIRFYQALLGGSRILKRVNSVLGQKWPSAAHGFRL